MVELLVNRFILHHEGKDYCAGETVIVEEAYANELVRDYGTAFTIGKKIKAANAAKQEAKEDFSELPAMDMAATVVKPRKSRKG